MISFFPVSLGRLLASFPNGRQLHAVNYTHLQQTAPSSKVATMHQSTASSWLKTTSHVDVMQWLEMSAKTGPESILYLQNSINQISTLLSTWPEPQTLSIGTTSHFLWVRAIFHLKSFRNTRQFSPLPHFLVVPVTWSTQVPLYPHTDHAILSFLRRKQHWYNKSVNMWPRSAEIIIE